MRLCLVACSLHADLEIYISKRLKKIKSHVLRHVTITAAPRHPRAGGCWFLAPCGRSGPTCEMPGQCESPAPRASVYPRHPLGCWRRPPPPGCRPAVVVLRCRQSRGRGHFSTDTAVVAHVCGVCQQQRGLFPHFDPLWVESADVEPTDVEADCV